MRKKLGLSLVTISIFLSFFFLVEGLSHTYTVIRGWGIQIPPNYIQYDSELGWVNIPNINIPNMYGSGAHLKINSQGFRNSADFDTSIPKGKIRIICSGDSATEGDGVGNEENWCQRLSVINPRIETINMGQSGYDISQAYLRYRRDGIKFEHQLHIFAFPGYDLDRMESTSFSGRQKPTLKLINGKLQTINVPVPKERTKGRWLAYFSERSKLLGQLASVGITARLIEKLTATRNPNESLPKDGVFTSHSETGRPELETVLTAVEAFRELEGVSRTLGNHLLILYLPMYGDYYLGHYQETREILAQECKKHGLRFLDLTETMRKLPLHDVVEGGTGHYMANVHSFVAEKVGSEVQLLLEEHKRTLK